MEERQNTLADRNHADVIKHMEMIQNVISRLADNSFKVKQWSLISLVAIFTIFGTLDPDTPIGNPEAALKLFSVPRWIILGFFLLDTYFVYLERCYRKKFDNVRQQEETDFDMSLIPLWREGIMAFYSRSNFIFYILILLIYSFGFSMFANFGAAK